MNLKGLLLLVNISIPALIIAGPTGLGGEAPRGSISWSPALSVVSVGNDLFDSGPQWGLMNRFSVNSLECPAGSTEQLVAPNTTIGIAKLQGLKASLLAAQTSGAYVKVRWLGYYCWVDDVVVCTDKDNCPTY